MPVTASCDILPSSTPPASGLPFQKLRTLNVSGDPHRKVRVFMGSLILYVTIVSIEVG